MVVAPVVHAVVIGQRHVHVGSIFGDLVAPIRVRLCRVQRAALGTLFGRGLVQRRKQHHKKRHVIGQRHPAEKPMPLPQRFAKPTVSAAVTLHLLGRKVVVVCNHIPKHCKTPPFPLSAGLPFLQVPRCFVKKT
ncbi:hypothetical protein SDC9_129771 [bioreactor metagenome]|uniref:Uncharacterized protein n=1 Tax=bioreactor metagenome TaxID=1076179 RepID=A0A645D0L8_9ZZZZ